MATYYIVAENTSPLDPDEIEAGDTITPGSGDIYIFTAGADKNTTFDASSSVTFEIQFNVTNTNGFDVEIKGDTNPQITIADNVELANVFIKAENAETVEMTIGDNVTLDNFHGSGGNDTIVIGDDFETNEDFDLRNGDDSLVIGTGADLNGRRVEGGGDNDTVVSATAGLDLQNFETELFPDGIVDGTSGDDTMNVGYSDIETDQSGTTDDTIVGYRGSDSIQGGDGADYIYGDYNNVITDAPAVAAGAEVDTINIVNGDLDGNGDVKFDIDNIADDSLANDVTITDSTTNSLNELTIAKIGGGDNEIDVIRIDLSTFDDDFTLILQDETTEDKLVLLGVEEVTDNGDGTFTYTYIGSDGLEHTVTADPDQATVTGYRPNLDDEGAGAADDTIEGGAGNDTIDGGWGDDDIEGGNGADSILGGTGSDTIDGGSGNDNIQGGGGVSATSGDDSGDDIDGGDGADTVDGGAGNDTIEGGSDTSNDSLLGGDGNDSITDAGGVGSNDTLKGEAGDDTLSGGSGNDFIDGGGDDDSILGGDGNDTISGGESTAAVDPARAVFQWSNIPDPDDGGQIDNLDAVTSASQTIGGTTVSVSTTGGPNQYETTTVYTAGIDAGTGSVDTNSSLGLDGVDSLTTIDFTTAVENVEFRINDFEANSETIQINAYDENNNLISFTVTEGTGITGSDTDTISGNDEFEGPLSNTGDNSSVGSILVQIAGPVARIEIDYTQTNGSLTMTDVWFDDPATGTAAVDSGNDTIDGGAGADSIDGFDGADSILGGAGNDTINGGDSALAETLGPDLIVNGDFSDTDPLTQVGQNNQNFDVFGSINGWTSTGSNWGIEVQEGDHGTGVQDNDQVTELDSGRVIEQTVTVSETGTYRLSLDAAMRNSDPLENGLEVFVDGVSIGTIQPTVNSPVGYSFDIPLSAGSRVISFSSLSNAASGSVIDNVALQKVTNSGAGDTIDGGTGNDLITGGLGDDSILLTDSFGNDTIDGSEDAGNGDVDVLDTSGLTEGIDITFAADIENGTLVGGTSGDTVSFSNIENIVFTDQDDTVDGSAAASPIDVNTGAGDDSLDGSDGADTLTGGAGADTLDGADGADSLVGGAGDDAITVDQGDTATGGDGDDYFTLVNLDTSGTGNAAINITGGEGAETLGDTLQLTPDVTFDDITFTDTGPTGLSGNFTMADGTVVTFSEIENIICFTPGTRIMTGHGERRIETLQVGDLVVTRDHGLQPIRWIGQRTVPAIGRFAPISIASKVLEGSRCDLVVSPQHRILFTGYQAQLLFGESEVLVAATHLVDGHDVRVMEPATVTYLHIMFDQHEVIYAEGIAAESFHAGEVALSAVSDASREEMFAVFPELRSSAGHHRETARPCLKKHEAKLLQEMRQLPSESAPIRVVA